MPWQQLYTENLNQAVYAEDLGFASIWLSEHHFSEEGYLPSLGVMLNDAQSFFRDAPWLGVFPGVAIVLLALAMNLLSIPVVPLCLAAVYYAVKGRFVTHRKITRFLYPVWLYVSVTGVLVFVWLRLAA